MHSVAELERDSTLRLETTGLTLAEGKQILKHLQEVVVEEQVHACLVQHRQCAICNKPLSTKGHHQIKLQTVFGNLRTRSPRLRCCPCGEADRTKSFSPSAQVLTERSTPERLYLETLFASLAFLRGDDQIADGVAAAGRRTQCGNDSQSSIESGRAERRGTRARTSQLYRGMPSGLGRVTDSQWPAHDRYRRRIRTRPTRQRMVLGNCRKECLRVPPR